MTETEKAGGDNSPAHEKSILQGDSNTVSGMAQVGNSPMVSMFPNSFITEPQRNISIAEAVNLIRSGAVQAQVTRLRKLLTDGNSSAYSDEKRNLPGITWIGTFSQRNGDSCTCYSGNVILDIDHIGADLQRIRALFEADEHVVVVFLSPSGDGLKVVVRIDLSSLPETPDKNAFPAAWYAAADHFERLTGVKADKSGKDISRLCYMSYDPDCFFRENPIPLKFETPFEKPVTVTAPVFGSTTTPRMKTAYLTKSLESACQEIRSTATAGGHHETTLNQAHSIGGLVAHGMGEQEAFRALVAAAVDAGATQKDAEHVVGDGLKKGQEKPRIIPERPVNEVVEKLLKMSPLEYSQRKKEAAKELKITVSDLEKIMSAERKATKKSDKVVMFEPVEPWPEPVNGAALLNEIYTNLRRYAIAEPGELRTATLWIVLSWLVDYASVLPNLIITAPDLGCGKSNMLTAISVMIEKALVASGQSASAVFRAMEQWNPTLMFDEVDESMAENAEIQSMLNAGHTRASAYILRSEKVDEVWETTRFCVFCPKLLAGIDLTRKLKKTLISRSLVVNLRKKLKNETCEKARHIDAAEFLDCKRRLKRWTMDNGHKFSIARPDMGGLFNRSEDNLEPIFAISDIVGGEWPRLVRMDAEPKGEPVLTKAEELLHDILDVFETMKIDRIGTAALITELISDGERPWLEYRNRNPITMYQLAAKLKGYGIHSQNVWFDGRCCKGYLLENFTDARERYLNSLKGGVLSASPLEPSNSKAYEPFLSARGENDLAAKNTPKSALTQHSSDLAAKTGGKEEKGERLAESEDFDLV
ncbi:MAG: DUF3631 domain-containing protein [Candidatus Riflebacteria bacterium]|nr:DUF3631 domain-containing protein [Candidatus Riflebacteria bacterium]